MARTGEKVRSLIAEDGDFADALSVVLARTSHTTDEPAPDGGTQPQTVRWNDISDELTSGQWGRLIETGILTDTDGDGFAISDPEAVREALDDDSVEPGTPANEDDDGSGWTTYDKLAGVGALGLMAAYLSPSVMQSMGSAVNTVIGPLASILPFYAVVIVLSILLGLYSTMLQGNLMNTEKMSAAQEKMNNIQERRKKAKERDDDEALERIQEEQMEAMGDQLGMFKQMFRPMVWITFLTIPMFIWMLWQLGIRGANVSHLVAAEQHIVLPLIGEVSWTDGIIGPIQVWLIWYFLCSIAFRQIIEKSLDIKTNPT